MFIEQPVIEPVIEPVNGTVKEPVVDAENVVKANTKQGTLEDEGKDDDLGYEEPLHRACS